MIDDLEYIKDKYSWIHGEPNTDISDIKITIFVVTIGGSQLKYCIESINNLSVEYPLKIEIIRGISPTSKAFNMMVERCTTDYFIQMDEDMELFPDSIKTIKKNLKKIEDNEYCQYYYLIDDYFGISNPPVIIGLKVYNYKIMKNYHISDFDNKIISSVDQLWQKQINEDGYKAKQIMIPIGYHARKRKMFDILLRFCKMTKSILDPRIKSHQSDKPKLVKPIGIIKDSNKIYRYIVQHFIKMNFPYDRFIENNKVLHDFLSYISPKTLRMYGIPDNYKHISINNDDYESEPIDKLKISFGKKMINMKHIYGIIGIVNTLFENYQYSYEYYPYKIDEYFNKIFTLKVKGDINKIQNIDGIDMDFIEIIDEEYEGEGDDCLIIDESKSIEDQIWNFMH
tara:strand:+ start:1124 stop:2314 length:1191 start_codon:yes stop_codon:yes gene_type:complete